MATALLVPVTFFMAPIPAVAAIVTATAMAIFSGDIPGCLLRMPGTPASAAYTDEAYAMTQKGQAELALGAGLVFSAIGGLFGTAVLIVAAPALAEFALKFSSFEYFWLVLLGLTCAVFITSEQPLKGFVSLLLGLLIASVGPGQSGGISSLHVRQHRTDGRHRHDPDDDRHVRDLRDHPVRRRHEPATEDRRSADRQRLQGDVGIDEKVSDADPARQHARYRWSVRCRGPAPTSPHGCRTRSARSCRRNRRNSALVTSKASSRAAPPTTARWPAPGFPALVFGIPGDSITAIVIGVLYMKNMNPGPTLFTNNPQKIYAVYLLFIIANLIMIPLGLVVHQGFEADPEGAAQRADAGHPAVLRGRLVRDQQHDIRCRRDAPRRRHRATSSRTTVFRSRRRSSASCWAACSRRISSRR